MEEIGGHKGTSVYEWMEGGFFLIHHYDSSTNYGIHVKGEEYISFDEATKTLPSHLIGADGSNFTYTWRSRVILGLFGLATKGLTTFI